MRSGAETAKFNAVKFAPVGTTAMRLEFEIAPNTDVGVTEWRVGPERTVVVTDNLHIAGSSVFPTGGWAFPTFTIVALSLRLADRLQTLVMA